MTTEEAIRILRDDTWIHEVNEDGTAVLWTSYADKFTDALDLAIAALERDRWISVESEIPVSGVLVLAATEYGVYYGFLNGNRKWFVANNTLEDAWTWNPLITHWRPLPEPPKEK